jgi:hypothetical protein
MYKKFFILFLCFALLFVPFVAYTQNVVDAVTIVKIGSSMGAWATSGGGRLMPTLLKAGLVTSWVVSALSPASIGLVAAAMLFSYAAANPQKFSKLGEWAASKSYYPVSGVWKTGSTQDIIPTDLPQYTVMQARLTAAGFNSGDLQQSYSSYALYLAACSAYSSLLQQSASYYSRESTEQNYTDGSGYSYYVKKQWNSLTKVGDVPGIYELKYITTCFKDGESFYTQGATVFTDISGSAATTAGIISDALVTDISAQTPVPLARSAVQGIESVISDALYNPAHGANAATTPTTGVSPVDVARAELNKGVPDAVKNALVTAGAVPAAGTDVTTAVKDAATTQKATPDIINNMSSVSTGSTPEVVPTITAPYTKTAWSEVGNFGTQFNSFRTSLQSTGVFALPALITAGMPGFGAGNPVIQFDAGMFGSHTYDFSAGAWPGILVVIRAIILLICSIVAVRIIILKR